MNRSLFVIQYVCSVTTMQVPCCALTIVETLKTVHLQAVSLRSNVELSQNLKVFLFPVMDTDDAEEDADEKRVNEKEEKERLKRIAADKRRKAMEQMKRLQMKFKEVRNIISRLVVPFEQLV